MAPAERPVLTVAVAFSPRPRVVDHCTVELPLGSDLRAAVVGSGVLDRHGLMLDEALRCGVWGKLRPLDHPLRHGDRVEIYRPLKVDPKEARRKRYRAKGRARDAAGE